MSKYGLDRRFVAFVANTMIWTIVAGIALFGLILVVREEAGDIGSTIAALCFIWAIGGMIAAPVALIAFAVLLHPSAMVFSRSCRALAHRTSEKASAMIAASVTALVAGFALWAIAALIARDFDGIFAFGSILFGPVSLFVAPVVAGLIYRGGAPAVAE